MTVLVTKRLSLSWGWPPTETEMGQVVEWLNDPYAVQYSEQRHRKHTIDTQYAYLKTISARDIYARIYLEHEMIGTIHAAVDWENKIADVGILLGDRSKWGKGYGLEAWSCLGRYLRSMGIRKMEAGCMAANEGMMRICERYGMEEEGRRKDHFLLEGKRTDLVYWGKLYEPSKSISRWRGERISQTEQRQASEPEGSFCAEQLTPQPKFRDIRGRMRDGTVSK